MVIRCVVFLLFLLIRVLRGLFFFFNRVCLIVAGSGAGNSRMDIFRFKFELVLVLNLLLLLLF